MRKKQKEKKSKIGKIIAVILALFTLGFIAGTCVGIYKEKENRKAMEQELLQAIDNCISVCIENAENVEIPDIDFKGNILQYEENIDAQQELLSKAYVALTMTTYAIDTINLNNPKTNYEVAIELGDPVDVYGKVDNYEPYANAILQVENNLLDVQNKYMGINE